MSELLRGLAQLGEVPQRVSGRAKKLAAQVVVNASHAVSVAVEMGDRLRANQPARTGDEDVHVSKNRTSVHRRAHGFSQARTEWAQRGHFHHHFRFDAPQMPPNAFQRCRNDTPSGRNGLRCTRNGLQRTRNASKRGRNAVQRVKMRRKRSKWSPKMAKRTPK